MKLNINIDADTKEPEIMITTAHITEDVNRVVEFVSGLDDAPTIISGIRDDKVELLDQEAIVKIYAEDGKVFTKTDKGLYRIRLRLYEVEERLDSSKFVRISNSEIVNLKRVNSLDLSFVGTICMELSNGEVSYVSRRYITAVIIQTVLSAILGAGFSGCSIIWEKDEWSLLKQTGVYFSIVSVLMMSVAYICGWVGNSLKDVLIYFGIFFVIFIVVWIVEYLIWKARISKIKEGLQKNN